MPKQLRLTALEIQEIEQMKRAEGWDQLVAKAYNNRHTPEDVADFVDSYLELALSTAGSIPELDRDASLSARAGAKLKDQHIALSNALAEKIVAADRNKGHVMPRQKTKVARRVQLVLRGFAERAENGGKAS